MAAFLIVQRGEDIGRRFDLDTTQLTIGRGSDNDMVLNDPMVSRYHAVVKRQGSGYLVIDLGSSNPVVINEHVCEPGEPRILQHRDVVFIGKTVFSFQSRTGGAISTGTGSRPQGDNTIVGGRPMGGTADMESPTPLPPSRNTPAPASKPVEEERTAAATPKLDINTAPSMPTVPPAPSVPAPPPPAPAMPATPPTPPAPNMPEPGEDDRTMVAGMIRNPEPSPAPFMPPPPPPPGGMRTMDDDSTRPTPNISSVGAGAPPPPPPPPFAPPRAGGPPTPPIGGPNDDGDGDMPTQIVPRRP